MKNKIESGLLFALVFFLVAAPVQAVEGSQACGEGCSSAGNFHFPGEFEPQQAIWMALPTYQYTVDHSSWPLILNMLLELTPNVHVNLLVPHVIGKGKLKAALAAGGVSMDNITIYVIPYADIWLRDMGPIYVVDGLGGKKIVDFKFNGWGLPEYFYPEDIEANEQVDRLIAASQGLDVLSTDVISEGGNRELNGLGTMIAIKSTELGRNPNYTEAQLEAEYSRLLGVSNVIWLAQPLVEDSAPTIGLLPGSNGTLGAYAIGVEHVDEIARFASPTVILLAEVTKDEAQRSQIAAENRIRLEAAYRILKAATDQDGKPFKIIRVPAAEILYDTMTQEDLTYQWLSIMEFDDGSVFPAPEPVEVIAATGYMNYVVSNGVVLVPKYYKPGMPLSILQKDMQAVNIFKSAFPGRRIVAIDPLAINLGGGGMHCITQQEPVAG